MRYVLPRVVELIHERQVREHGGTHGVLDAKRLEAILGRAEQYAHYATDADVFDLAALYLEGIAHDHPFRDGNKRTAWVVCRTFLRLNGTDVVMSEEKVLALAIGAAKSTLKAESLGHVLREHAKAR
jgi:death on curing protein